MDVRGFVIAVVGSVVVHAIAIGWYAKRSGTAQAARYVLATQPAPEPMVAAAEPPPIEVVFLDDAHTRAIAANAVAVPAAPHGPTTRGTARLSRGGATPGETGSPATGHGAGTGRSPLMTMRHGDELRGVSGDFLGDFLDRSKPIPPPPDLPGERVGNEIAEVRAQLRRAGRYSPDELAGLRARLVALDEERAAEEIKPAGGGTYKSERETFQVKIAADGSVKLEDKPSAMDAQDRMMLRHGIDPYGRNKLAYLDKTREQRVAIGTRYRHEQLGQSVVFMQQHIDRLWRTTRDPGARKQGLFDLWDECLETGTADEVAGGTAARVFVMSFITAKLRGPDAYTAAELATLNASRHSRQAFAPNHQVRAPGDEVDPAARDPRGRPDR